jgi:hypothetical protein
LTKVRSITLVNCDACVSVERSSTEDATQASQLQKTSVASHFVGAV